MNISSLNRDNGPRINKDSFVINLFLCSGITDKAKFLKAYTQTYLKEDTRDIQKSYLSYWAFKVPVMLEGQRLIGKLFMSIGFSFRLFKKRTA